MRPGRRGATAGRRQAKASKRKAPMTFLTPRSFNGWLRRQLREKKLSQRQLALHSGVHHSTISRIITGDRMPSLGTATRLARGLREIVDEADGPAYFASLSDRQMLPTARVEYALRGDEALSEEDIRGLMDAYLSARASHARRRPDGERQPETAPSLRAGKCEPSR